MPWRPEDWSEWPVDRWPASGSATAPAHLRALYEILRWLPDCASRVVSLDPTSGGCDPSFSTQRWDVVVAADSIGVPSVQQLDAILERISAALVEGGVFLATFPATVSGEPETSGPRTFHEVELQYRLRRAGFQGLRLRRFRREPRVAETILSMAVRRALN